VEITKERRDETLELRVKGRLDAYWADHLANALEEAIRGGDHHVRLDLAEVSYMSSAGIRILLKFFRQLERIRGELTVSRPSEAVRTVLELAGLTMLLLSEPRAPATEPPEAASRRLERDGAALEVFAATPGSRLRCRAVGAPGRLLEGGFRAEDCHTLRFPASTFGLGVGAFGSGFADCRGRFGEFLVAAGAAAYLPTDGTNVADDLVASGDLVPEITALYALACEGTFAHLVRFEAGPARGRITLAELARMALDIAGAEAVGMVMVAESAGLVGAALRRSPTADAGAFGTPEMREWLSFTTEPAYGRSLVLAVGVAARTTPPDVAAWLRPLQTPDGPAGHFHAAAFSYHAFPKGLLELAPTVATLFESAVLQGVLHLLGDDREPSGVGQSEFVRGACWLGPIAVIEREGRAR